MNDKIRSKVTIGITFILIMVQALLFTIIAESKTQEFIIMLIGIIFLSESRLYIQRLALIREEEIIEMQKNETEKNKQTGAKK